MEKPKQMRIGEPAEKAPRRGAPLRCVVPDCQGGTVGDECMCRGCWERLPWGLRSDAGAGWRPPTRPAPGWLRDALAALGAPVGSVSAGEALSPAELRFRPKALAILATHEFERPDYDTCTGGQHPCPWVSCPKNLYLERTPGGTMHLNHPGKDVDELEETCAEDVVRKSKVAWPEKGAGVSAARAAALVGVKRGRVGQIERKWKAAWRAVLDE